MSKNCYNDNESISLLPLTINQKNTNSHCNQEGIHNNNENSDDVNCTCPFQHSIQTSFQNNRCFNKNASASLGKTLHGMMASVMSCSNSKCNKKDNIKDKKKHQTTIDIRNELNEVNINLVLAENKNNIKTFFNTYNNQAITILHHEDGNVQVSITKGTSIKLQEIINACTSIEFENVLRVVINEDLVIDKDFKIKSKDGTIFKFNNNKNMTISNGANVEMKYIHLNGSEYDDHLINICTNSKLNYLKGKIYYNRGLDSILYVASNAVLSLVSVTFFSNITKETGNVSGIFVEREGDAIIEKCKFLSHTSEKYPNSSKLIYSKGNIKIKKTKFEDNIVYDNKLHYNIIAKYGNVSIANEMLFEKTSGILILNAKKVTIDKCDFFNNNNFRDLLSIKDSKNINLKRIRFMHNASNRNCNMIFLNNNSIETILTNCFFSLNGNEKYTSNAICLKSTKCQIIHCDFEENKGNNGRAMFIDKSSMAKCVSCNFASYYAFKCKLAVYIENNGKFEYDTKTKFHNNGEFKLNPIYYENKNTSSVPVLPSTSDHKTKKECQIHHYY